MDEKMRTPQPRPEPDNPPAFSWARIMLSDALPRDLYDPTKYTDATPD